MHCYFARMCHCPTPGMGGTMDLSPLLSKIQTIITISSLHHYHHGLLANFHEQELGGIHSTLTLIEVLIIIIIDIMIQSQINMKYQYVIVEQAPARVWFLRGFHQHCPD